MLAWFSEKSVQNQKDCLHLSHLLHVVHFESILLFKFQLVLIYLICLIHLNYHRIHCRKLVLASDLLCDSANQLPDLSVHNQIGIQRQPSHPIKYQSSGKLYK